MNYLLGGALCVALYFLPDIYYDQRNAMAFALTAGLFVFLSTRLRLALSAFISYLVFNAFYHGIPSRFPVKLYISGAMLGFEQTLIVLLLFFIFYFYRPDLVSISRALAPVWAVLTLCGIQPLWNYSCNAAMLIVMIPFQRSWWVVALCLLPAYFQMGTTPLFVAGAMFAYYFFRRRVFWPLYVAPPLVATWGFFHPWRFDEHERWDFYWRTIKFFAREVDFLFGTGFQTFPVFGPTVQGVTDFTQPIWLSVHSDYIQYVFENGLAGAGLMAWLLVETFRESDEAHRAAIVGMLAFGVFYFPMAIPFFVAWSVALVMGCRSDRGTMPRPGKALQQRC